MNSSNPGPDTDVAVWYVATSGIDGAAEAACAALLDEAERERAQRMASESRRREFRIGRALLRTTLSRYADRAARDWRFRTGSRGKPAVDSGAAPPLLEFSLSHTAEMTVCAVGRERPIGVDVERRDRPADPAGIAARWFSAVEAERIERSSGREQRALFLRLWTLKEAYLKACGSGFAVSPRRVVFDLAADGGIEARFPDDLDAPNRWAFRFFEPDAVHGIAIAAGSGPGSGPLTVSWNETDPLRWGDL